MIRVTRLSGKPFVVNAEQIKTIEETPDTLLTLLNGDRLNVKEPMSEVVRRAIDYLRTIRTFSADPA